MARIEAQRPSTSKPGALDVFGIPGFRLLVLNGGLASVSMVVRTMVHGWLVLSLSQDSPLWVGISVALMGIGQMISSIFGGAIADRFQRRALLMAVQATEGGVAGILAVTTYFDVATLPLALGLALFLGTLRGVAWPATNLLVYDVVGPQRLLNAMAFWRMGIIPMMIFGSLTAGALIGWAGIWAAYAFIGAAGMAAPLFLAPLHVRSEVDRGATGFLHQVAEGLRYAATDPPIRTLFSMSVLMEFLGFSFMTMMPVVARIVLETGPLGLGLLSSSTGAGALLALVVMASLGNVRYKSRLVFGSALGAGVSLVAFSMSRSLPLSMALAMLTMGFLMAYDLALAALMQLLAPGHLRGRVISLHSVAIAFMSLGGFAIGAIGSVIGVPVVLATSGVAIVLHAAVRRLALLRIQEPHREVRPGSPLPTARADDVGIR